LVQTSGRKLILTQVFVIFLHLPRANHYSFFFSHPFLFVTYYL